MPLSLIHVTPAATNAPRTTERNQTESVSGSAARRRTKVLEMKSKSIGASTRRAAHAAGGARLGDVEEAGRRNRHHEIEDRRRRNKKRRADGSSRRRLD